MITGSPNAPVPASDAADVRGLGHRDWLKAGPWLVQSTHREGVGRSAIPTRIDVESDMPALAGGQAATCRDYPDAGDPHFVHQKNAPNP